MYHNAVMVAYGCARSRLHRSSHTRGFTGLRTHNECHNSCQVLAAARPPRLFTSRSQTRNSKSLTRARSFRFCSQQRSIPSYARELTRRILPLTWLGSTILKSCTLCFSVPTNLFYLCRCLHPRGGVRWGIPKKAKRQKTAKINAHTIKTASAQKSNQPADIAACLPLPSASRPPKSPAQKRFAPIVACMWCKNA